MKEEVIMPAFGLAENVLYVSAKLCNTYPPTYLYVDQAKLQQGEIVPIDEQNEHGKWLVSCGESCSKDGSWWRKSNM
jgi:hypothetical protein